MAMTEARKQELKAALLEHLFNRGYIKITCVREGDIAIVAGEKRQRHDGYDQMPRIARPEEWKEFFNSKAVPVPEPNTEPRHWFGSRQQENTATAQPR